MEAIREALRKFGATAEEVEAYVIGHPVFFESLAVMIASNHPLGAVVLNQIAVYLAKPAVPPPLDVSLSRP